MLLESYKPCRDAQVKYVSHTYESLSCPEGVAAHKKKKKRPHARAFWKKAKTDGDKKLMAVQSYLADIGLTWPVFQSEHRRPEHAIHKNRSHFVTDQIL